MNRKKALRTTYRIFNSRDREISRKIVSDIYDDFESRTCENCKHWVTIIGEPDKVGTRTYKEGYGGCNEMPYEIELRFGLIEEGIETQHKDFGCNKWEARK